MIKKSIKPAASVFIINLMFALYNLYVYNRYGDSAEGSSSFLKLLILGAVLASLVFGIRYVYEKKFILQTDNSK